ncbi:hypothetical protein BX600DRAFT_535825 [Xylariales sp. PMI_506]|nr:hypothetical protein BX600DRAFT_535825 [Xylariales sp. PMI_506]
MSSFVPTIHYEPYDRLSPSHLQGEFAGRAVLITGGGTGIGAAVAHSFAEARIGAIILAGRREGPLAATAGELAQSFPGLKVSYQVVDVTSEDSVKAAFESLETTPDILVNNAGYLPDLEHVATARIDEWWKGFQINVLGTTLMTQAFLRGRAAVGMESKSPGVVVTINTFGAIGMRAPNFTSYAGSKIAILRILELITAEVPQSVARFISVNPGMVRTALAEKSGMVDLMPATDVKLASDFVVWAASLEAVFLNGRFAWVNWDVDELVSKSDEVLSQDLLITSLKGW